MIGFNPLRTARALLGLAFLGILAGGCATKSYVRDQVAELSDRTETEHVGMRGDISRTGTLAQSAESEAARAKLLALGHVDYRTIEQFDVAFGYDSAELDPQMRMTLDRVVSDLRDRPNTIVDLLGHACSMGPEAYNEELSRRRASAVHRYFVQTGPGPVGRYAVVGLGESIPVLLGGNEDHEASRRVEVRVLERIEPGSAGSKPVISLADPQG